LRRFIETIEDQVSFYRCNILTFYVPTIEVLLGGCPIEPPSFSPRWR
jgi:hypothetical protein